MERLRHVVVGPRVKAVNALGPAVARREDENRDVDTGGTPFFQDRDAVLAGQADVEDDDIIGLGRAKMSGLLPVVYGGDGVEMISRAR